MPRIRRIGLLISPTTGYFADVIAGVQEFVSTHNDWLVEICPTYRDATTLTRIWRPDGFLFDAAVSSKLVAFLKRQGTPAVQVGGQQVPQLTRVSTDNVAIGRLAAEHFLARGFRHFAFCGYSQIDWSRQRRDGYCQELAKAGATVEVFPDDHVPLHVRSVAKELRRWLEKLEKPVAVFACHDRAAMLVGKACELAGLHVPDKVAILGVDNNPAECFFTNPPLSSIMGSARRIGYEAAAILEARLDGGKPEAVSVLIPPAGVEVRASTDVLAVAEDDLAAAIRYIHDHAGRNIGVEDVAEAVLVSRRQLERKFQTCLKRSPKTEIVRAHVERAKRLLIGSDMSALVVAMASGFPSCTKFCTVFKRETGLSPIAFRRRYGLGLRKGRLPESASAAARA